MLEQPKQVETPNFENLIQLCQQEIEDIENGRSNSDTEHYIYEAAMEAVFGKDCWKWINSQLK